MKRAPVILVIIAAATLCLALPAALAQSDKPKNGKASSAPPPLPPAPLYDMSEAPEGYTLKQLEFFEVYCFNEVNKHREANQLAPLVFLDALLPAARSYSRQLAEEKFFSHTDPLGRSVEDRVRPTGIRWLALGENLSHATGFIDPVEHVVASWMRNPQHRANILDPQFKYAAMGLWIKDNAFFFTEVFLSK